MIKCVAIDDEPLALRQLTMYLSQVPYFELVASCQSALDAMGVLEAREVDAVFVDINMPDLNGLDFVRSLSHPPLVVLTTAYQEYAVEGYKVNAVDYLLKPFGLADVLRAADKVRQQHALLHAASLSPVDEYDAMFLRTDYKVVRILVHDIVCVEGYGEYLRIYQVGQERPLVVYLRMKEIEERLSAASFMRVHKSYIVNLHHIVELTRNRIVLDTGTEVPVGDSYRESLNNYIASKFLGK